MTKNPHMSEKEKEYAKELYKAHFTAKEAALSFSFGYATLRNLWRAFEIAEIEQYDRRDLILEEGLE